MHFRFICSYSLLAIVLLATNVAIARPVLQSSPVPGSAKASPKVEVTIDASTYTSYYLDLPSNVESLTVRTATSGNVDVFVRAGTPHTATNLADLITQSAAYANGPGGNETVVLQRNGTPTVTPGRWWFTILNPGNTSLTTDLTAEVTTGGAAFVPSIGQSGVWSDPERSQQGFFVQYLSAAQVFVAWFTYTPEGEQAFLFGIGQVAGDRIEVTSFNRTRGGRFGDAFEPGSVIAEDWGDLIITMESCTAGYASFLPSREGWPPDQLRIRQLTTVPGLNCGGGAKHLSAHEKYLGNSISGVWNNPSRSGEGWVVQTISPTLAVFYWFTFDPQGKQAWFGGIGEIVDGSLVVDDAIQPSGGRFGVPYPSSQVTARPWGAMGMTLKDCTRSVLYSVGPPDWGDYGSNNLSRLTALAGVPGCDLGASPLRLSGAIRAVPATFQDGDTNNPDNPNIDNDNASQPQVVPTNPAIISGYATFVPTGGGGDRFAQATDQLDGYRLTVTAGQTLQLIISDWDAQDPTATDLDLELYSTGGGAGLIDSAMGTGRNEFLTVEQTGTYDVVVRAYAGSSNYVLAISNSPRPVNAKALTLISEFVSDEIILRFDEPWSSDETPKALYKGIVQREAELGGLKFERGEPGRPQLWRLPAANRSAILKALGAQPDALKATSTSGWSMNNEQRQRYEHLQAIKALSGRENVRYAEPNYMMQALGSSTAKLVPNDPRYREQWHYPMINLPQAWDITEGSSEVVVAVIDSGVNPHPDIAANIRSDLGLDAIDSLSASCDGNRIDPDASDPGDSCGNPLLQGKDSFHGTHVAGTVAAVNGDGRGVAGVAPAAKVMPVRVLGRTNTDGSGTGSIYDIARGIIWSAGESVEGTRPSRGADVLNLSLGGSLPCPETLGAALQQARSKGVPIVVAAGNENSFGPSAPADCPGVIKVAAVNRQSLPAQYSNCREIDVAAPGGELGPDPIGSTLYAPLNAQACKGPLGSTASSSDGVLSTGSARGNPTAEVFKFEAGTSMAAPHVAGVIALMKATHPGITANDVDALLAAGRMTFDPRDAGVALPASITNNYAYYYGRGIVDALGAVRAAKELAGAALPPATIVAQPTSLDFGDTTQTLTLTVSKVGTGAGGVQSIGDNVAWLNGSGGGPDGLGQYALTVNRSGLPGGEYNGQISIVASSGNIEVPVRLRVGALPESGQAGAVYALLLDALTLQVVGGTAALLPQGGNATFTLPSVLPGSYYLLYGTDNDNDQFICDDGEYCGLYPSGDNAGPLRLSGADLDIGISALFPDVSGLGQASSAATKRLPEGIEAAGRRADRP